MTNKLKFQKTTKSPHSKTVRKKK